MVTGLLGLDSPSGPAHVSINETWSPICAFSTTSASCRLIL